MFVSFYPLFSLMLLGSIFIAVLGIYLNRGRGIGSGESKVGFLLAGIVTLRLLFPVRFVLPNWGYSQSILPDIIYFLDLPVWDFSLGKGRMWSLRGILYFLWGVGILLEAGGTLRTHFLFRRMVKGMPAVESPEAKELLKVIVREGGRSADFQILYSDAVSTPMLYDFRRPKIIVPSTDYTPGEWRFILSHEIAHYYNRDLEIKAILQLLKIIYWWNPFVYLLNGEIDREMEIRADASVTKTLSEEEKVEYLDCLLKVAKGAASHKPDENRVTFEGGHSSVLSQRFHVLLDKPLREKGRGGSPF